MLTSFLRDKPAKFQSKFTGRAIYHPRTENSPQVKREPKETKSATKGKLTNGETPDKRTKGQIWQYGRIANHPTVTIHRQ